MSRARILSPRARPGRPLEAVCLDALALTRSGCVRQRLRVQDALPIQTFLAEARKGKWRAVNVLVGSEAFLVERAVRYLRQACLGGQGVRGLNDDVFHGKGLRGAEVAATARTLPMMATSRFVLVRGAEAIAPEQLDAIAEYVAKPSPSTCLVVVGEKLDARSKLVKAVKALATEDRGAYLVVEPLKGKSLDVFVAAEVKRRRCTIDRDAEAALVDAVGADLAALDDAIERLSLFVASSDGRGGHIDRRAVAEVVERVRVDTVWRLVDAVALRRRKQAFEAVGSLLSDREEPPRILFQIARQLRIVARMKQALDEGLTAEEAARRAGAPPFKARDLADAARKFSDEDLCRAFQVLARTDQALKGSKREPGVLLEEAVLELVG